MASGGLGLDCIKSIARKTRHGLHGARFERADPMRGGLLRAFPFLMFGNELQGVRSWAESVQVSGFIKRKG